MLIDPQIKQCASAYPEPKREVRIRMEPDGSFTVSYCVNDTIERVENPPNTPIPSPIALFLAES